MKIKTENEQTKSNPADVDCVYNATISLSENVVDNEERIKPIPKTYRLKAYHPKMMIAYKSKN